MSDKIVLTGDRPTGPLHLGHYVGTLQNRIKLQNLFTQYVMIADLQALTDYADRSGHVRKNVFEVILDYLAVGIDPSKTTIFLQSQIPEIAELAILYLNLVTVNRLLRNPTVKTEIQQKQFGESIPAGFLVYPVHQAADITIVKGTLIPVGQDQLPMIEQTNEIVRTFNRIYSTNILHEVEAMVPQVSRLVGIDGASKMSKSLGNALFLSDSPEAIAQKVMKMYTDPGHLRVQDPGKVEGNVVFTYLDVFDPRHDEVELLKEQYRHGGLGDVVIKKRLIQVLDDFLSPIRERREDFAKNSDYVWQVLKAGTIKAREVAAQTYAEVKQAVHLDYFS